METVFLQGYDIVYSRTSWRTRLKIIFQSKKILTRINREKAWLGRFLYKNKIDLLISDNRYGLSNPDVPSILITHQLGLLTGFGCLIDRILQWALYRFVSRFHEVWIPDEPGQVNLAGVLSHPKNRPGTTCRYIGTLSRMEACEKPSNGSILFLLSGPEPQRTLLERKILDQIATLQQPMVLVRGYTGKQRLENSHPRLCILDLADTTTLNRLICEAELIICRPGYTSLMDLLKLKKKLIVVPTPGQAEQEYLASYLHSSNRVLSISQQDFDLENALRRSGNFQYDMPEFDTTQYKNAVSAILRRLKN